jgi:AraC-like DNA-binding protein
MNNQDHLMLRLARLKSSEECEQKGEGLTFVFAKGGTGKYLSKLATYRLSPGDILVFNGSSDSKLAVTDGKGVFLFWVFSLCFENLLPLFAGGEISLLHKITDGYRGGKVYPANTPLAAECHGLLGLVPGQFNLDHRGQLIRIAATVLSAEFKEGFSQRNGGFRPEDHMVQVFEKLSASELINLSVGELAGRFSCSRRHLNRLFHQHFGVSVASLRMEMRLLKAVSLLRDANAKVINVAEECGFNHLGLFNTCFKRRFGASPGQWRKSNLHVNHAVLGKPEEKPNCPLHFSGLCPLNGQGDGASPAVPQNVTAELEGKAALEQLKHQALMFGDSSLANLKRQSAEARGNA